MKVAISSTGPELSAGVDPRFGRAPYFVVVDTENGASSVHDNTINLNAAHGAGIQAAKTVVEAGAKVVITGDLGPKAMAALKAAGVEAYQFSGGDVKQAVEQFKQGRLTSLISPNT